MVKIQSDILKNLTPLYYTNIYGVTIIQCCQIFQNVTVKKVLLHTPTVFCPPYVVIHKVGDFILQCQTHLMYRAMTGYSRNFIDSTFHLAIAVAHCGPFWLIRPFG